MTLNQNNNALPSEDLDRIVLAYLRTPIRGTPQHPANFVWDILHRAYTEWCLENPNKRYEHSQYLATGLLKFIDDETHYALRDSCHKWDEKSKSFRGLTNEDYIKARVNVIDALVKWSLKYFDPEYTRKSRNIRVALEEYIRKQH